jgi:IMP dehydrogenase
MQHYPISTYTAEVVPMELGRGRQAIRAYGFDEVAIAPGAVTIDPEDVDISTTLGPLTLPLPVLASAMDAVTDPNFAVALGRLGGLGVLNLEGLHTRYANPQDAIARIASADSKEVIATIQQVYTEPVKDELIGQRIEEIRQGKAPAAVSAAPASANRIAEIIGPDKIDVFVVQVTVTTARHISSRFAPPDFNKIKQLVKAPVIVGNCTGYQAAFELIEAGADGILVGVGPGAACTTRRALGIGVPQITAIVDVAAARDDFERQYGRRPAVIADGGMKRGGDICKAIAAGADAVMIGSPFAAAKEAPGKGYHWGMATANIGLPRGTRIKVGTEAALREILLGPTSRDDGTRNLMGALRLSMGSCGARNLREMQSAELIIAPAFDREGKTAQRTQGVG